MEIWLSWFIQVCIEPAANFLRVHQQRQIHQTESYGKLSRAHGEFESQLARLYLAHGTAIFAQIW